MLFSMKRGELMYVKTLLVRASGVHKENTAIASGKACANNAPPPCMLFKLVQSRALPIRSCWELFSTVQQKETERKNPVNKSVEVGVAPHVFAENE